MKTKNNVYKPQKAYSERMKAKGFVRTGLWVPESGREAILEHAEKLRKKHDKKGA